jgi:putative flippase GtrA
MYSNILKNGQFLRFVIIGTLSSVSYLLLFIVLINFGIEPSLSGLVSYLIFFIFNYLLQKKWTFKTNTRDVIAFPKFCICHVIASLLNFIFIYASINYLELSIIFGQLIAFVVILSWNYFFQKRYVFNQQIS